MPNIHNLRGLKVELDKTDKKSITPMGMLSKDTNNFSDLTANECTVFNQTNVYYADRKKINALLLIKLIKNSAPDSVYLNSFFSFKFRDLARFVLPITYV